MTWPLLERELRRALRHRRERQIRLWGTVICAALASLFLLVNAGGNRGWGMEFSHLLLFGGLILILQVPSYTAGVFAEERRNQTLGLLFLCGIGGTQLFLSKTLGAALVSFSRLLLLYPFLAIAFLGGGLSADLFLAITCSLPVTLLFVFAVCVFASVCCREESTALALAVALAFSLCLPVPLWLRISPDPINSLANQLLVISPARAPYLAATQLSTGSMAEFWTAATISLLWSGLILAAAAFVLERVWQDQPDRGAGGGGRAQWSRWLRGDWNWRRGLAQRWHEINPYIWLAQRDRWPVMLAWAALAGGFGLWLGLVAVWWKIWLSPAGLFVVAVLANSVLNAFVHFAAAKAIGEARSSGALELLLTAPLSHLDVARGQLLALREQFRPHGRILLVGNVIMLLIGLVSRPWTGSALGIYLSIWAVLLAWTGSFWFGTYRGALVLFWDSLVCGRPAYVVLRRMNFLTAPVWWIYLLFMGNRLINGLFGRSFQAYPAGSPGEWAFLILMGLVLVVVSRFNWVHREKIETRLATDFRIIAAVPAPEPSDPRYKHWKSGEPFPDMLTDYLVGRVLQQVREREERTRTGTNR
jgi:ABC-type transport system involved in multi-copper enzyme maturation permease subunit